MKEQKKPLIPKEALPKDLISHLENLKKRKEKDKISDEEWGAYSEEEEIETKPTSISQVREKETCAFDKTVKLKDIFKPRKDIPQRRYSPKPNKRKDEEVLKKPVYRIDSSNLNKREIQRRFEDKYEKRELEKRLVLIKSQIEENVKSNTQKRNRNIYDNEASRSVECLKEVKEIPKFFNPSLSGSNIKELSTENDLFLKKMEQEKTEKASKKIPITKEKIKSDLEIETKKPMFERCRFKGEGEKDEDGFCIIHKNKEIKKPFFYNVPKEIKEEPNKDLKKKKEDNLIETNKNKINLNQRKNERKTKEELKKPIQIQKIAEFHIKSGGLKSLLTPKKM